MFLGATYEDMGSSRETTSYVDPTRDPGFRIFASTSAIPFACTVVILVLLEHRANAVVTDNEAVKARRVDDEMGGFVTKRL